MVVPSDASAEGLAGIQPPLATIAARFAAAPSATTEDPGNARFRRTTSSTTSDDPTYAKHTRIADALGHGRREQHELDKEPGNGEPRPPDLERAERRQAPPSASPIAMPSPIA